MGVAERLQCSILVVDDDPRLRAVLCRYLRRLGAGVVEAPDVRQALERLATAAFDVVITDLEMPGPSGWSLVSALRRDWPHLPVIVITGGSAGDGAGGKGSRPPCLLRKPFLLEELRDALTRVLPR